MPLASAETLHATCVAIGDRGVLLTGPAGSGKSDLALRLIECAGAPPAARLVADDRVVVEPTGGRLVASPPPTIAGRLEVRGLGIVRTPYAEAVDVALVVELVEPAEVRRWPDRDTVSVLGVAIPRLRLAAFEASAPAKIRAALRAYGPDGFAEDIV
jgi:serine kinase of HPr protein (carbohydrate metabolism regulator)